MAKNKNNLVDEGFRISLVETAFFDGLLEIPRIEKPQNIVIPNGLVPFSMRERGLKNNDFVCFYENDIKFREILTNTEDYLDDLKRFPGIISPDCSLYLDAPLCVQIAGIYLNRAVGHFLQKNGINVIPNIRWGDERTYTTKIFKDKIAFLGAPYRSIVSIGTYGQIKTKESKKYFREGLIEMLNTLEPTVVLVYGSMPESIFHDLMDRTTFVSYPDWITRIKKGNNGFS